MNRKIEQTRIIAGSPNEKLFTIVTFHETRLTRIEQFLGTVERFMKSTDSENPRVDTLEENLNVAFDSLQSLAQKVEGDIQRIGELEKKIQKMAGKGSNTTKLAVLSEQLRLLSNKVEGLETTISNNTDEEEEDSNDDVAEEN